MMRVFEKVLSRYEMEKSKPIHQVIQYPYTISSQKNYIIEQLLKVSNGRISFIEMIQDKPEKILVIFNFLAILELLQLNQITLHIGEGFNNFWVEQTDPELSPGPEK
jgi:segregation and condensation protein A